MLKRYSGKHHCKIVKTTSEIVHGFNWVLLSRRGERCKRGEEENDSAEEWENIDSMKHLINLLLI